MISIIIPAHNNLRHLKNAYTSVKKHAPEAEVVLLDDASTDGTWEWIESLNDEKVISYKSPTRDGHTVLYDMGIQLATNDIVGIMHADMIMGPNYVENVIKHLKPGTVVCATRIEPPLHPPGKEKIIMDFGMDFDSLNVLGFEQYCDELQVEFKDQTTKGMFAPWALYKEDFIRIGGHDWGFAPFPYEDSDIFQRWILAGYELVQSRDAFVYHLTCRGHRWTGTIGKNDDYFTEAEYNARNYYIKKWGSWIQNEMRRELMPPYNLITYDKMRQCATVGAALGTAEALLTKAPANAKFTTNSKNPEAIEFCAYMNWNLRNLKETTWYESCVNILSYLQLVLNCHAKFLYCTNLQHMNILLSLQLV
jgi:glycosyltransferase involved in cell wall biosynthesis